MGNYAACVQRLIVFVIYGGLRPVIVGSLEVVEIRSLYNS